MMAIWAGARAELHDRTKRKRRLPWGRFSCSRDRISWWGVGEAVNQTVILSFLLLFLFNALLTALFFKLGVIK